ncbi:hypothetical protein L227DRAFT_70571 [Lentinus tigrinus ALCF2SS1-6]|uniref:Uncharacterized protein n=1 Tax=Lentinus tigrinus ALCF2SS1-6 TaxID=1328759 RepID=A0A5C2SCL2_9APHY|nr:hypothetical protein L227DRAFT_70571 [Lentinus tigrinus ALCF2SS1-6]
MRDYRFSPPPSSHGAGNSNNIWHHGGNRCSCGVRRRQRWLGVLSWLRLAAKSVPRSCVSRYLGQPFRLFGRFSAMTWWTSLLYLRRYFGVHNYAATHVFLSNTSLVHCAYTI